MNCLALRCNSLVSAFNILVVSGLKSDTEIPQRLRESHSGQCIDYAVGPQNAIYNNINTKQILVFRPTSVRKLENKIEPYTTVRPSYYSAVVKFYYL